MRHKIDRDFEIRTDHLIPTRRPDLELINKQRENCHLVDFAVLGNCSVKKKTQRYDVTSSLTTSYDVNTKRQSRFVL